MPPSLEAPASPTARLGKVVEMWIGGTHRGYAVALRVAAVQISQKAARNVQSWGESGERPGQPLERFAIVAPSDCRLVAGCGLSSPRSPIEQPTSFIWQSEIGLRSC